MMKGDGSLVDCRIELRFRALADGRITVEEFLDLTLEVGFDEAGQLRIERAAFRGHSVTGRRIVQRSSRTL